MIDLHLDAPVLRQDEPAPQQFEPDLNVPETHEEEELAQQDILIIDNQANDQPESARLELDESLEEIDVPDEGPVRF